MEFVQEENFEPDLYAVTESSIFSAKNSRCRKTLSIRTSRQ
jgi:hypothetical protein